MLRDTHIRLSEKKLVRFLFNPLLILNKKVLYMEIYIMCPNNRITPRQDEICLNCEFYKDCVKETRKTSK